MKLARGTVVVVVSEMDDERVLQKRVQVDVDKLAVA